MVVDKLVEQTKAKKNPCIVGIDPMWSRMPQVYSRADIPTEGLYHWACDVIDAVKDIVPAVKPQMAYFEVFGGEGVGVFQKISAYAHEQGLLLIDDSKRGDIGSTAQAYAYAHLDTKGPINADFLTVSPFLGTDSIQPFFDMAEKEGKGLFVLVKPSNPGSGEIGEARKNERESVSQWLASYLAQTGGKLQGSSGYSSLGAVVGATYPQEANMLRSLMPRNYFLVPGFGTQGGTAEMVAACFNPDGLGAVVSSSRGILYGGEEELRFTRTDYQNAVRERALTMRQQVYELLKERHPEMNY